MPIEPKPKRNDDSFDNRDINPNIDSAALSNSYSRPKLPQKIPKDLDSLPPEKRKMWEKLLKNFEQGQDEI